MHPFVKYGILADIYICFEVLYYAETLFLPAPAAHSARSLQLLPWRSPDALVLPAQEPPPNPTPLPGRLVSPSNASSDAASEQARFDAFLAHQFQESVQDDPLSLHFLVRNPENYGITEPEMKFQNIPWNSQKDSEENAVPFLRNFLPSIPLS